MARSVPARESSRSARPLLLVLLWIWAACVFLVVDLFWNVTQFDAIRPRAKTYQAIRWAAHDMVGEPLGEAVRTVCAGNPVPPEVRAIDLALARMRRESSIAGLREQATGASDPRVRIVALRALADRFPADARPSLLAVARDTDETEKVRAEAARFLGRTGTDALGVIEGILGSPAPEGVRSGAALGLGELSTEPAARLALTLAAGPASRFRGSVLLAIERMSKPDAWPVLIEAMSDAVHGTDTRVAACHALAQAKCESAVLPLVELLADGRVSVSVRAAAAQALGVIGRREGLAGVEKACRDPSPEVARQARLSTTRLSHVRVE